MNANSGQNYYDYMNETPSSCRPTHVPPRQRDDWDTFALRLALEAADSRSEDPYVQVGAVVLRHNHSVGGVGYNGPPPDVDIDWTDRDDRRLHIVHAEINALSYVRPGECGLIAVTLLPCNPCLTVIAAYGIKKIVFQTVYDKDDTTLRLARKFGIELKQLNLNESKRASS